MVESNKERGEKKKKTERKAARGSRRSSRDEAVVATIMAGLGVCIRTEAAGG